jgi:hypothetical protein
MHIETDTTKGQRLQAIREKIQKTTDPKEKAELAREARAVRIEQARK